MMNIHFAFMLTIAMSLSYLAPAAAFAGGGKAIVYVGTSKREASRGIYAWRLDAGSGKMEPLGLVAETMRPLFLALHPSRRFLYAVSRPTPVDRQNIGVVLAYAIESQTGKLTPLNSLPSRGIDPVDVSVDRTGKNLLVANFGSNSGGGSVAVFPIKGDGSLAEASDFIQYSGSGVNPQSQQGAHSHAINLSPDNRFAFVADLGLDKIFAYRFDQEKGKLTPNNPPFAALHPGAGQRQFVFHPNGRFFYVINQIQSSVTTFAYHASVGTLKELQTVSTLPKDFTGTNTAAAIQVYPTGRFFYGSNRGHNSIAVFSIAPKAGTLTLVEWVPSGGKTPGSFGIDPSGNWLIAANQSSDTLVLFRIDPKTGRLRVTGQSFEVGSPSCVRFLPLN